MGFSNGKKILRINNLKKINTAVYQCNVSNIYGYVYDNAFLKVFGKLYIQKYKFFI